MSMFDFFADKMDRATAPVDNIGGIQLTVQDSSSKADQPVDKDDKGTKQTKDSKEPKELTKAEVLKIVRDYIARDTSILSDLAKLCLEDDDRVWGKAQELALDHKVAFRNYLVEVRKADTTGEIQEIINDLTTAPAKSDQSVPAKVADPIELNDILVYEYIEHHPDLMKRLEKAKPNMKVPTIPVYFRKDDTERKDPLKEDEIKAKVFLNFNGDFDAACSPTGWYTREIRIKDSAGNPTEVIYSEDDPKKGKLQ